MMSSVGKKETIGVGLPYVCREVGLPPISLSVVSVECGDIYANYNNPLIRCPVQRRVWHDMKSLVVDKTTPAAPYSARRCLSRPKGLRFITKASITPATTISNVVNK